MKRVLNIGYSEVLDGISSFKDKTINTSKEKTGGVSSFIFPSAVSSSDKLTIAYADRGIKSILIQKLSDIKVADFIIISGASEGWISW